MKTSARALISAIAIMLVLSVPSAALAQHKHGGAQKVGLPGMNMAMMQSPHHKLMTAYMKSMLAYATALRDQSTAAKGLEVDIARATVAEMRHTLDAMEALHHKHMQSMSAEMQSKMQMMMEKMEKEGAKLKDQVSALETDVQADKPDSTQVTTHVNALLKHLEMMSTMHGGSKGKKKMGMKMDMKKM